MQQCAILRSFSSCHFVPERLEFYEFLLILYILGRKGPHALGIYNYRHNHGKLSLKSFYTVAAAGFAYGPPIKACVLGRAKEVKDRLVGRNVRILVV